MFTKILNKLGYTKEEISWILYDIGNSQQTLMTNTVLFPLLIAYISPGDSSVYVGWAHTVYGLILVLLSPILGTIADYKGKKMKFFKGFLYLGLIAGFLLAVPVFDYKVVLFLFILAMIGYNGSIIFYDAFIVDVTTDERMNKVSSAGYAWGYIGSVISFIPFIIPFAAVTLFGNENGDLVLGNFTLTYRMAIFICIELAIIWWYRYSRPMMKNVTQKQYHEPTKHIVKDSFERLLNTFKNIKKSRNIFLFCLSYFFYIDCVNTVITMAVSLATDMGISDIMSLFVVIAIQFLAFPSAIYFGKLTEKFGEKKMILVAILGYFFIIFCGSQITKNPNLIWAVGILVGLFQGGIQAVSRSYFTLLIPEKENANEYFGFFSVFSKFSAILGPLMVSLVISLTNKAEYGILGLIPMMIVGGLILLFVEDPKKVKKESY